MGRGEYNIDLGWDDLGIFKPNSKRLAEYARQSPQPETSSMYCSMWNPAGYANRHLLLLFLVDIIMP